MQWIEKYQSLCHLCGTVIDTFKKLPEWKRLIRIKPAKAAQPSISWLFRGRKSGLVSESHYGKT